MILLEQFVALGAPAWWGFLGLILFGRSMDLFSTWMATPNLVLEANPIARRLGWRAGVLVNLGLALGFACWPLLAISLSTTSLMVAARNLQHAWLMRTMGEHPYRFWFSDRVADAPRGLVLACHLGEALLTGVVGGGLLVFARFQLVPFAIGLGILAYAVAIAVFTTLSILRRSR